MFVSNDILVVSSLLHHRAGRVSEFVDALVAFSTSDSASIRYGVTRK